MFCAEQVYDTMGHFLIDTARRVINVLVCLRKKSTEADPKACFETRVLKGCYLLPEVSNHLEL